MDDLAEFKRALGDLIRRERLIRGIGLNAMAKHLGISSSSISRLERGTRIPTWRVLVVILTFLQVKVVGAGEGHSWDAQFSCRRCQCLNDLRIDSKKKKVFLLRNSDS